MFNCIGQYTINASPFTKLLAVALSYSHSINRHSISPPCPIHRVGQMASLVLRSGPWDWGYTASSTNNGSTGGTEGGLIGKSHSLG